MRQMRNKLLLLTIVLLQCILMAGCEKQICSYCGEEKECDEYDILGTKRYICSDCLGSTAMSLSGNVIVEYESDLIDPAQYLPSTSVSDNDTFVAGDLGQVSDNSSEGITAEDILSMDIPSNTNEEKEQSSPSSSSKGKDEIVGNAAALLSSYNYYIQPDTDNPDAYHIYYGSDDAKIIVEFIESSTGVASATIRLLEGAKEEDFTNVCINMNLAFLGSADYEQDGKGVYNSAQSYGNYSNGGCKFYYMDGLEAADNDGATATYEIKYE